MNKERALLILVALDVVLTFSVIGGEMFFGWTLPGSLKDYVSSKLLFPTTAWQFTLFALWAANVGLTVASWVALLNLWWFARRLYVTAWGLWILIVVLSGPSVLNPVGAMFDSLERLVAGAIIGLVFFSDLSRHFERPAGVVQGAGVRA